MQVQINSHQIHLTEEEKSFFLEKIEQSLSHFNQQVTNVFIFFKDHNATKAGIDKECLIEARISGFEPMVVNSQANSFHKAMNLSSKKIKKLIQHKLEKIDSIHHKLDINFMNNENNNQ